MTDTFRRIRIDDPFLAGAEPEIVLLLRAALPVLDAEVRQAIAAGDNLSERLGLVQRLPDSAALTAAVVARTGVHPVDGAVGALLPREVVLKLLDNLNDIPGIERAFETARKEHSSLTRLLVIASTPGMVGMCPLLIQREGHGGVA